MAEQNGHSPKPLPQNFPYRGRPKRNHELPQNVQKTDRDLIRHAAAASAALRARGSSSYARYEANNNEDRGTPVPPEHLAKEEPSKRATRVAGTTEHGTYRELHTKDKQRYSPPAQSPLPTAVAKLGRVRARILHSTMVALIAPGTLLASLTLSTSRAMGHIGQNGLGPLAPQPPSSATQRGAQQLSDCVVPSKPQTPKTAGRTSFHSYTLRVPTVFVNQWALLAP